MTLRWCFVGDLGGYAGQGALSASWLHGPHGTKQFKHQRSRLDKSLQRCCIGFYQNDGGGPGHGENDEGCLGDAPVLEKPVLIQVLVPESQYVALRSFVSCEVKIKINASEQVVKCTFPMKELSDKEDSARTKNWCGLNEL
jgi:hypothetical protein